MQVKTSLRYLEDRWDEQVARGLDQPELLRYRSNLLGSDLRITNFGGGNTSSKIQQTDPLSGKQEEVLWIKGSGGDLGSIKLSGLASLYSEKLQGLEHKYRGADHEDEMVEMYPLCAFGKNTVAASIDTPLHGFCLSRTSTICILTGVLPWPLPPTDGKRWKNSTVALTII